MGQEGKTTWVVLIDKSPRGPLNEEEILILLHQRIAHHNDLAFQVGEGNWKFLWQFEPFNRRKNEDTKKTPPHPERRQKPTQEQLKQKLNELLPEELASILPEDLVLHGHTKLTSSQEKLPTELPEPSQTPTEWSSNHRTWVNLGISLFLLAMVTYQVWSPSASEQKEPPSEREPSAVNIPRSQVETISLPQKNVPLPLHDSNPSGTMEPNLPKPKENFPSTKDSGEISQEEYERKREERWAKERKEEEDRYKEEAKALDEEEKAEAAETKTMKKKTRKIDSEEVGENNPDGDTLPNDGQNENEDDLTD